MKELIVTVGAVAAAGTLTAYCAVKAVAHLPRWRPREQNGSATVRGADQ